MKTNLMLITLPLTLAALAAACSSSNESTDQAGGGGAGGDEQGGGGESGGAGEAAGKGGQAMVMGGTAGGGAGGVAIGGKAGSNTAGVGGSANPDAGADAAGGSQTKASYECTTFIGPNVTGEWFAAGFEALVSGDKWQVKAPHHSFVEDWANPGHAVWKETCEGQYYDCQTKSKCAGGKAPDRVIFVTQTGNHLGTSQQAWQTLIASAIPTIKAKYPNVKNIELMTFVRGPGNKDCGNETTVSPNLDKAQQALADASNGFITVSPRFEVSSCSMYSGQPHLSAQGNKEVAQTIGKHYAALEKAAM
ncbi:MAG: hypothetical protein SF187_18060 [Deltaproteobacteria bacterium]|nr:hypothetical protein [Deltaproteobacteria bacterium]